MEQRPSWEANRFSATQEIPRILWNPKVRYRIHNGLSPVLNLSHSNPVHAFHVPLLQDTFYIILPSMLRSSKWSLSLRSPHQNAMPISFFLIWWPEHLVSSTGHKAPRYVVFSTPLLPHSSLAQTPWLRINYTEQLLLCILTFYSTCSRTQSHARMHNRRASSHFK